MTAEGTNCAIEVLGISKSYGKEPVLREVSLKIKNNEFFTLLGPSGCGKTTMLRIIAGFEEIDGGEIFLFGENIEKLPPYKRPINTVFQHYALFPHMTVFDNVQFGLRMLKVPPARAARRAAAMLELVRLSEFSGRRLTQLSGGQQQRVALARALAPAPKVLLLDESLSALDLKLRQAMRVELKQIQRETGITFVFVTHDQEEALTMSDRIAVMSQGSLQQVGTAREIYETPVNRFVADFIGEVNLLPATMEKSAAGACCVLADAQRLEVGRSEMAAGECFVAVRPEKARIVAVGEGGLRGTVEHNSYMGAVTETHVRLAQGALFLVRRHNTAAHSQGWEIGREVGIVIEKGAAQPLR